MSTSFQELPVEEQIQYYVDNRKHRLAERLILASQEPATMYQVNSAKGLAAIRKG